MTAWTLKVTLGDEVRRLKLWEETPTAEVVRAAVAHLFAFGSECNHTLHFEYFDDEGDACTLTDATFPDFLGLSMRSRVLRLYVYEKATSMRPSYVCISSPSSPSIPPMKNLTSAASSSSSVAAEQVGVYSLSVLGDTAAARAEDSVPSTVTDWGAEDGDLMSSTTANEKAQGPLSFAGAQAGPALDALRRQVCRAREELQAGVVRLRTDLEAEVDDLRSKLDCARTDVSWNVEKSRTGVLSGLHRLHGSASRHVETLKSDLQDGSHRLQEQLLKCSEHVASSDMGPTVGRFAALATGTVAAASMATKNPVGLAAVAGTAALASGALAIYTAASAMGDHTESNDEQVQYASYVSAYMDDGGSTSAASPSDSEAQEDGKVVGASQIETAE